MKQPLLSRTAVCLALVVATSGCAVSPQQFAQRKQTMSDTDVCRAAQSARQSGDAGYITMVNEEGNRRRLTVDKCNALITQEDRGAAIAAVAAVGIAALAIAANQDSGTAAPPVGGASHVWVRSFNERRQPVWVCKEVKTGKVEEPYHCGGRPTSGRD